MKLSLLIADMVSYIENLKELKKLLESINRFIKVVGFKINIQKLISFLNTSNTLFDNEI